MQVDITVGADIVRRSTHRAVTGHTVATVATNTILTITNTVTTTRTATAAVAGVTRDRAHTPHKAALPRPRHTRTTRRLRQTRSRLRHKNGATRAFRCPRCSSPSRRGGRTVASCVTDTGTGGAITSRWTSTSCTRHPGTRTRPTSRGTPPRRTGTWTITATFSSTTLLARSSLRVSRARVNRLCCLMRR
jgi:hypothetical protein